EVATIRSAQLVSLGPKVALLVVVLSNGSIEKRTLELDHETGDERMAAAGAHLAAHLVGRTLHDLGLATSVGDAATDALVTQALTALGSDHEGDVDHVFVAGASRMAAAFDAVDTVREVLGILEQQYVVVTT